MYFDSHAHLDDAHFDGDRAAILDDLKNQGVTMVMNVGCDLPSSERSVRLAEQYPFLYAAVGSHPDDADHVDGALLARYRALCASPRVRAIGEIGLDYHYEDVPRTQQRVAFEKQLSLAEELDLPVIVHEREAHGDAMDILRAHPRATGVFHCFSGSPEMALWLVERGWYIGFTGVVTFKNARRAVTHWSVIARYNGYTHIRCELETGRTHQIRVHMAHIGHPLLGDLVYGHKRPEKGLSGQCLHARALRFIHPRTGELVTFTCPLPEYFQDVLARLGTPIG